MTYYPNAEATGFHFVKSTYSSDQANCVECAAGMAGETCVRDSKDPHGPAHRYPAAQFAQFAAAVATGSLVPVSRD